MGELLSQRAESIPENHAGPGGGGLRGWGRIYSYRALCWQFCVVWRAPSVGYCWVSRESEKCSRLIQLEGHPTVVKVVEWLTMWRRKELTKHTESTPTS